MIAAGDFSLVWIVAKRWKITNEEWTLAATVAASAVAAQFFFSSTGENVLHHFFHCRRAKWTTLTDK